MGQFRTMISSHWNLILATLQANVNSHTHTKKLIKLKKNTDLSNKLELSPNTCIMNVANVTSPNVG